MLPRFKALRLSVITTAVVVLAACQPVAPPAPPVVVPQPQYQPRAPLPPLGASVTTVIPALRADGLRDTIHRDLGPLETLWHVRVALNVAAVSCRGVQYEPVVANYNTFISKNKSTLRNANSAVLGKFRREQGRGYRDEHDRHQTKQYNYWSYSPLRRQFCDQSLQISQRAIATPNAELNSFAAQALAEFEQPFTDFYAAYEQYQRDLQAWNAQYAPTAAPSGS